MDKFLDAYDLLKLKQVGINHLNRSITRNEIKAVIISQQGRSKMAMETEPQTS
jgi:hypothetical protein